MELYTNINIVLTSGHLKSPPLAGGSVGGSTTTPVLGGIVSPRSIVGVSVFAIGGPTITGGLVGSITTGGSVTIDVGMNDPPPTGGSVGLINDVGVSVFTPGFTPKGGSVGSITIIVGISVSVVGTGAGGTG